MDAVTAAKFVLILLGIVALAMLLTGNLDHIQIDW